jgi:hypothetical protein
MSTKISQPFRLPLAYEDGGNGFTGVAFLHCTLKNVRDSGLARLFDAGPAADTFPVPDTLERREKGAKNLKKKKKKKKKKKIKKRGVLG